MHCSGYAGNLLRGSPLTRPPLPSESAELARLAALRAPHVPTARYVRVLRFARTQT